MYFESITIHNYKSFRESDSITFNKHMNVVVGKNNCGKSALLESLALKLVNAPHIPLSSSRKSSTIGAPSIRATVRFTPEEFRALLLSTGTEYLYLNLPTTLTWGRQASKSSTTLDIHNIRKDLNNLTKWFNNQESYKIEFAYRRGSEKIERTRSEYIIADYDYPTNPNLTMYFKRTNCEDGSRFEAVIEQPNNIGDIFEKISGAIFEKIYMFQANRNIGTESEYTRAEKLKSDGSNLAETIMHLSSNNYPMFQKYIAKVKQLLPEIEYIDAPFMDEKKVQARIWSKSAVDYANPDLTTPLSHCGSGVSQILAIIFLLITQSDPLVIVIDEPQTFLHPGLERMLIKTLLEYPQHQYIISTHSPITIKESNSEHIILVRKENGESNSLEVSVEEQETINLFLNEIGVRLSDVFGADQVLWVEGETEEAIIPKVIKKILNKSMLGLVCLKVDSTGSFNQRNRKNREQIIRIYKNLCFKQKTVLMPPTIAFIFDREDLSPTQQYDLKKIGQENEAPIFLLPVTMIENYLLDPLAIAEVFSKEFGATIQSDDVGLRLKNQVEVWQKKNHPDVADFDEFFSSQSWVKDVHGANILTNIFNSFGYEGHVYQKTKHSVELANWILDNKPESLREVAEILEQALSGVSSFSDIPN